jgi:Domain of unknown function (DUF397)
MDWRKSSFSGANGGNCVEVASACGVMVRDSADHDGVTLSVPVDAWSAFMAGIKQG